MSHFEGREGQFRGQKSYYPTKKIMSRSFLNSGTLIVIIRRNPPIYLGKKCANYLFEENLLLIILSTVDRVDSGLNYRLKKLKTYNYCPKHKK